MKINEQEQSYNNKEDNDREEDGGEREEPIHMLIVEWLALNNVKYHD